MRYDDEFAEREKLLQKYDSLMRKVNPKELNFRSRRNLKEFEGYYEKYKQVPLDEKLYLTAANREFSRKLSKFEKLLEEKKNE